MSRRVMEKNFSSARIVDSDWEVRDYRMISTNDFKPGMSIELDGVIYQILESQHVKPGKGSAFVRTKLKNVKTGVIIDKTFNAGEKVSPARVERRPMQYLYSSGDQYFVMDMETYEQIPVDAEAFGESVKFLKENMTVTVITHEGTVLGAELPTSVELKVVETDPGLRGDTASGGSKPAKLETGAVVRVPLFINGGDVIKVDTRTGDYLSRV